MIPSVKVTTFNSLAIKIQRSGVHVADEFFLRISR